MKNVELSNEEKIRIKEILREKGYIALGIGLLNGKTVIGAKPQDHEKIIKEIQKAIKDELGIDSIVNL